MKARDLRLVPVAVTAWAAALWCVFVPQSAWLVLVIAGGAAVLILTVPRLRRWRGTSQGIALVCLFAITGVSGAVAFALDSRTAATRFDGRAVDVVLTISSSPSKGSDGRLWADAEASALGFAAADALPSPLGADVPVRVGVEVAAGNESLFVPGATVQLSAQAKVGDSGERAALVLFSQGALESVSEGAQISQVAAVVREAFVARSMALPSPGSQLLPGLAVGDTRAVSEELNAAMLASGLSHLTAVSGSNCALITAAAYGLVALLGGARWLRIVCAAIALSAFVVLVTAEPSVVRAAAMSGLAMLSILLGRPKAGLAMLLLAVTVLLIGDPWLAATPGFALSAAATGALIVVAPPLAKGMERWMPPLVALALAVPLAAQIVCAPIIALFAEEQSLIGVVANLLAAPAAPIATVIGLLACLAMPIPWLADLFAASAWLPSAWIAVTAETTAALPAATVSVPAGVPTAIGVAVLSAATGWLLAPRGTGRWPRAATMASGAVVAIVVGVGAGSALIQGPVGVLARPADWAIAACDVGQGDAVLVKSAGQTALIDVGPDADLLSACLTSLGVTQIDLLVLTHFDLDHVGGIDAVVGRIGTVMHSVPDEGEDAALIERLRSAGAKSAQAALGMRGALGESSWRVLWPRRDERVFPVGNDASVIIEFHGGDVPRSLFLGDLGAESQRMLQRTAKLRGPYAVVKVAHHGSADQDAGLYAAASPTLALLTVGDNDYGHPREETLATLRAAGAHIARTDLQGQLLVSLGDDGLNLWVEKSPQ